MNAVLVVIVDIMTKLGTIVEKMAKEREVQMVVKAEMVVQAVTAVPIDHSRKGFEIYTLK